MVALDSVSDAEELLSQLFAAQLAKAEQAKTEMNTPTEGDQAARHLFSTLLPPARQRALFMKIVATPRYWPRLRTLIGVPPYDFLRPEDEGLLAASGIRRHRVHIAREHAHLGASSSNFGPGHFLDEDQRTYKVVDRGLLSNDLPWRELSGGATIVADVKVKARRMDTKRAVISGVSKKNITARSLTFPRVGETVVMHLAKALSQFDATPECTEVRARVAVGRPSFVSSNVARIVLRVE